MIAQIVTGYLYPPVGLGMFLEDCLSEKENRHFLKLRQFREKYLHNLLRIEPDILHTIETT